MTRNGTVPAAAAAVNAGDVQCSWEGDTYVAATRRDPNKHPNDEWSRKPWPVTMTGVPPRAAPAAGVTDDTTTRGSTSSGRPLLQSAPLLDTCTVTMPNKSTGVGHAAVLGAGAVAGTSTTAGTPGTVDRKRHASAGPAMMGDPTTVMVVPPAADATSGSRLCNVGTAAKSNNADADGPKSTPCQRSASTTNPVSLRWGGDTHVAAVAESTTARTSVSTPKLHDKPSAGKPVPESATTVPPATSPDDGDTASSVGAGWKSNTTASAPW